jgi:uncharacterized protein (DUF433 family)
MATITQAPHITFDPQGRPWIIGANTKVIEVALSHLAYGWGAEELHDNYPHLSLGQIHAALGYYYDNQEEMDRAMEDEQRQVEKFFQNQKEAPIVAKLRSLQQHRQTRIGRP